MDITFTLQAGFTGTQADDFTISGVTNSGTNTLLASNVTKTQLINGYTIDVSPTITGGTITSAGVCTNSVQWYAFGDPTPPPPDPTYSEYTGCGYGTDPNSACSDTLSNGGLGRTLYSDCASGEFGANCTIYSNDFGNALVGQNNVFINGALWDISTVTGRITALSSSQC
jgi:hypothetical protein